MDFIQTANKQVDKFGSGKHGFSAGNPTGGVLATLLSNLWCDGVQQELVNVIEAGGGVLGAGAGLSQLLTALPAALASRPEMARSLTSNGYQKLPGGLILQWGGIVSSVSVDVAFVFPVSFPSAIYLRVVSTRNNGGSANIFASVGAETLSQVSVGAYTASTGVRVAQVVDLFLLGK